MPAFGGPSIEELQALFPQLEILECIGRGGMGIVYKARQPHLDRFVALKILAPGLEADPGFAERFTREARTLAKLTHPNLVAVHDFGESGGHYYLVMEYVDGVNLRQAMQAARFTPEQALGLIPDLCAALQFAHDHGVLHRDIKPENILLDTKGRVKIADFGIARLLTDDPRDLTLTATGGALGSAAYMAPEQIEHPEDVDHRADIYSLGVVFYEMLTGGLPLGRFPAPSEKSGSDPRLDDVVFRALEKERERRYQSAAEVRSGVENHTTSRPTATSRPPASLSPNGLPFLAPWVKWPILLILAGLAVGGAVAIVAPQGMLQYFWKSMLATEYSFPTGRKIEIPGHLVWIQLVLTLSTFSILGGMIWGLWNLNLMKRGRLPLEGRGVLRAFTVWPLTLLAAFEVFRRFSKFGFLDPAFTYDRPWMMLVAFGLVYVTCRTLFRITAAPAEKPGRAAKSRWIAAWLSLALLISAEVATKQLSGVWMARHYDFGELVVSLPDKDGKGEPIPDAHGMVQQAVADAAGEYRDQIHGRYDGNELKVGFLITDRTLFLKHPEAFYQRFRAALDPKMTGRIGPVKRDAPAWDHDLREQSLPHLLIILATVLAAFLAAWCGLPAGLVPLLGGLAAGGVFVLLPKPPMEPELQKLLIDGPPLETIAAPPLDFSEPAAAVRSLYNAVYSGNPAAFRKALSKKLRNNLLRSGRTEALQSEFDTKVIGDVHPVTLSDNPTHRVLFAGTGKGARFLELVFEDGSWKLDSMQNEDRAKQFE